MEFDPDAILTPMPDGMQPADKDVKMPIPKQVVTELRTLKTTHGINQQNTLERALFFAFQPCNRTRWDYTKTSTTTA